jgi:unsaturated rhamnogalacturonyl hydrolase
MPWADPVTGKSPEFWGRSMGWVPVAVLEVLDDLPKTHRDRPELIRLVTDLLRAVCRYQEASGLWHQVLDKGGQPGNWLESSCTCLFAGAICKAVRNGFLEKQYLENAERAFRGIVDRLRVDEGGIILDDICVGTGVGDYAHYCARPRTANDLHGIGAFLYMCAEAAK